MIRSITLYNLNDFIHNKKNKFYFPSIYQERFKAESIINKENFISEKYYFPYKKYDINGKLLK